VVRGVREPVNQAEHRGRDERDAGQVQPGPGAGTLVLEQQQRSDRREAGEDQVHVQAPAPGQVLGQDAAEHQADRAPGADDRAVDAERRDVHDRGVEHDHELGEADGAEDQPPAGVGGRCHRRFHCHATDAVGWKARRRRAQEVTSAWSTGMPPGVGVPRGE
jgi:hypothetical protein